MKKIIYVVLDGLGDSPHPDFENKTPLEAARKPNLDNLATKSKFGLVYTVGKDIAPESDIAVISILGYDAAKYYSGRGPLESFASGLSVNDGDLAYRVNFATLGENKEIRDRRVGRSLTTEEATLLSEELNKKVKLTSIPATFKFRNTIGHRGVLVFYPEDGKLSEGVSNTDPAYGKEGVFGVALTTFENRLLDCKALDGSKEARDTARITNEFIEKSTVVLNESAVNKKRIAEGKLPANVILTRDAGNRLPKFPSMYEKYGLKIGCFVEMPVEQGIAILTGMEPIKIPPLEKKPQLEYPLWAKMALEKIKEFDALYIHIKGPDEPAHDGNFLKKKESIEAIDKYFFGNLLPSIDLSEVVITVTADHSTSCLLKAHTADPVPLLIATSDIQVDGKSTFDEKNSAQGSIGTILGTDIMPKLVNLAKK